MKYWIAMLILNLYASATMAYWNCAWPYRTEVTIQENSGVDQTNYQVELTLNSTVLNNGYSWTNNGFDLRVVDADDETPLDFWVERWNANTKTATVYVRFNVLRGAAARTIYLYYGNAYAGQLANIPFTFVEPGIKFHTRNSSANPSSLAEAKSLFNGISDGVSGYGCTFITNFTGVNNRNTFGAGNNFIATSETYFKVENNEVGTWGIRYGADFGRGGGLYVDDIPLEEDWLNDLWWANNWNNANVLQGSISLSAGYHKLEVIGAEGCCDGGITVQFQRPGGAWQTYSTANIDIRSRACPITAPTVTFGAHATGSCPPAVAAYRLDEGDWQTAGDVIDQQNSFAGSMIGTVNEVKNTQVCNGAEVTANSLDLTVSAIQTGVDMNDLGAVGSFAFWLKLNNNWTDGLTRKIMDASSNTLGLFTGKYFYLEKQALGNLQFRFEDSNDKNFTVTEAIGANRLADQWYHVTVTFDFPNNQFQIFVDDNRVANTLVHTGIGSNLTSGAIPSLGTIQFGDKIPSLLLGGSGRSADGVFDEIHIYDSVLSPSQIRGLMAKTRSCQDSSGNQYCLGTFPNGLNTIQNRTINFGENAQLINNPDNVLSAATVNRTAFSTRLTCDTQDCIAGDVEVNAVSPGGFIKTNAKNDVNVGFLWTETIGSTTSEFDNINVGFLGTLNFLNTSYSRFLIDRLELTSFSTLNLQAGTYWINELTLGANAQIKVVDDGPVRLYVNKMGAWSSDVLVNSPTAGQAGDADVLLMYFYDATTLGYRSTISGAIYSSKNLDTNQEARLFGLLTARNVTLGLNSQLRYDASAYTGLGDIGWCEQGQTQVASVTVTAPATAINCQPASIDLQVRDARGALIPDFSGVISLSTSTGHGDWTKDAGANGSLVQTSANSGAARYDMVAADAGQVRLYLKDTYPENVTVNVAVDNVNATTYIQYQPSGFVFSGIGQQVAAQSTSGHEISAVETDQVTGACQALLLNTQSVQLAVECITPTVCDTGVLQVQSTVVSNNTSGSVTDYSTVSLDFSDDSSSTATFDLMYSEAGQYRLHARYALLDSAGNATGNWIQGTSNDVVTTPAGFCITSSDANWNCTTPGLSAGCSRFKKAGENFNLTVTAKAHVNGSTNFCAHTTTQNFNGNVALSHSLVAPTPAQGGVAGSFNLSLIALSAGVGSITGALSEMGAFQFIAGGNGYLGASLPATTSATFGRFYPHDFHIVSDTAATFTDGSSGFTYVGQTLADGVTGAIGYGVAPSVTFAARNTTGAVLINYRDPFLQLPSVTATVSSATVGQSGTELSVIAGFDSGVFSGPDALAQYQYQFSMNDHFRFDRNANSFIAPFNNDLQLTITDFSDGTDGVSMSSSEHSISGSGGVMYYGRLRLQNSYGPETTAVSQFLFAEYFNGSDFVSNELDSSTPYDVSNVGSITVIDVGDVTDPLLVTDSSVTGVVSNIGLLSSGRTEFEWSAPLGARYGTYGVQYTAPSWLRYDWKGSGDEDPSATVSFGRFRGHDKVIYWKELVY